MTQPMQKSGVPERPQRAVDGLPLVILLALLTATAALSIDMYLPTLPTLAQSFQTSASRVQLTLSAFFLGFALGQLVYGPLSDQLGRKGPLLTGLGIYAVASVLCSLAPTIETLIAFRFLQAIGASAGPVLARAMVRDLYDQEDGARVLSYVIVALGVAPLLAPMVGGYVLEWIGWRAIFAILAISGALTFTLCLLVLPESLPPERRLTARPRELMRRYGQLLGSRHYLGYVLTSTSVYVGMYAYIAGSPFVFIQVYGVEARHYGLIFGLNAAGLMAAAAINGRLIRRLGSKRLLRHGVTGTALAGLALLGAALSGTDNLLWLMLPLFFFVASFSLVAPNAISGGLAVFPAIAGAASALSGALQFLFGALSSSAVGALYNATAVPMAALIAGGAVGGLVFYMTLLRR